MIRVETHVAKNKKLGLLCACNKVRVPYGPPPGSVDKAGIRHGYEHCEKAGAR